MRRHILAAFVLVPAAALLAFNAGFFSSATPAVAQSALPAARACDRHCDPAWMDANLRINDIQVIGTGQSYKQRPSPSVMTLIRMGGREGAEALDFAMPSLSTQLDRDVRALSFDVAFDPKGGHLRNPAAASMAMELLDENYVAAMDRPGFKVLHVLDVDYQSSCLLLEDCLKEVAAWSRAHPRHLPIVITLRPNDGKTPMPGATEPREINAAALDALDGEIRAAFTPDRILTPDQMQGRHANLRDAALAHAWPLLGEVRGKVIFVLRDDAQSIKAYQGHRRSLEGRAMFVAVDDETSPLAAFLAIPDPVKDRDRIVQAVRDGFMVRTRADSQTREARKTDTLRRDTAFASGAQIVETNFPVADPAIGPYRVSQQDNPRALCGPALGSEACAAFPAPTALAQALP
jgi:hypothetical protein